MVNKPQLKSGGLKVGLLKRMFPHSLTVFQYITITISQGSNLTGLTSLTFPLFT